MGPNEGTSCSCSGSARRRTTPSSSSRSARASKPQSADPPRPMLSQRVVRSPRCWDRLLLAACGPAPTIRAGARPHRSCPRQPRREPASGEVVPPPGSSSSVYEPNPGAIVVAIDPGHGGCLDWGVPDPLERPAASSEKVITLAIGLELKRILEEQGITVVMTRETDVALAGDDYHHLAVTGRRSAM